MIRSPAQVAAAFREACLAELRALKPGNVHAFGEGHGMSVADFEVSARVSAGPICDPALGVGAAVHAAVRATHEAVGCNTNLGILLLCAPLARAAMATGPGDPRARLAGVLDSLDIVDAEEAFRAIRLAAPGGLGNAERHDVNAPPTVGLREAMAEAADRDLIARQYATGFRDVFELGLPRLREGLALHADRDRAVTATYLALLAAHPDSHVARRHGAGVAERVRRRAQALEAVMAEVGPDRSRADLVAFDTDLKRDGVNPGTSADMTVATLLVARLAE